MNKYRFLLPIVAESGQNAMKMATTTKIQIFVFFVIVQNVAIQRNLFPSLFLLQQLYTDPNQS